MSDPVGFSNKNYDNYEDMYEMGINSSSVGSKLSVSQQEFMSSIMPTLEDLKGDFKEAMAALQEKIDNCDDPIVEQQLEREMDGLQATWREITHHGPGAHRKMGEFKQMWSSRIDNMRDAIISAHSMARPESTPVYVAETPPLEGPRQLETVESSGSAEGAGGAEASGGSSGTSGSSGQEWQDVDINKMIDQMSTDPQAVMDQLMDMPPGQRASVMQAINSQLQQLNQMISMMSNMQKAIHDTAKAAINNMRV